MATPSDVSRARGVSVPLGSVAAFVGRVFLVLSFLALCGAWLAQITDAAVFGMDQYHLFLDSIAMSVIGMACLVDALVHTREA